MCSSDLFAPWRSTKLGTVISSLTRGREKTARRGSGWRWAPSVPTESTAKGQHGHVLVVACAPLPAVVLGPTRKESARVCSIKSFGRASGRCGRRAAGLHNPGDAAIRAGAQHEIGDDHRPVYAASTKRQRDVGRGGGGRRRQSPWKARQTDSRPTCLSLHVLRSRPSRSARR